MESAKQERELWKYLNLDVKDLIDDPDMQSAELDEIKLSRSKTVKGLILFLVCSIIGIVVFFGSVTHADGSSETVFSFLYNSFLNLFGQSVYWILVLLMRTELHSARLL